MDARRVRPWLAVLAACVAALFLHWLTYRILTRALAHENATGRSLLRRARRPSRLAAVVAEELRVGRDDVDVEEPTWEPKCGYNATGGSQSMRNSWGPLRKAAASARVMLVTAGAARLGVDAGRLVKMF